MDQEINEKTKQIINTVGKLKDEDELIEYIRDVMSKLRFNSMSTGVKICSQMILNICNDDKRGMREKLRDIKKFCKTGLNEKRSE